MEYLKDLIPQIDPRRYNFSKEKSEKHALHQFQSRLYEIKRKAAKFKTYKIECIQTYESSNTDVMELMKQVFWLNLINYMTLSRIAEIILM